VFASQVMGYPGRQPAHDLVSGIHQIPFLIDFLFLGNICFHYVFSCPANIESDNLGKKLVHVKLFSKKNV